MKWKNEYPTQEGFYLVYLQNENTIRAEQFHKVNDKILGVHGDESFYRKLNCLFSDKYEPPNEIISTLLSR